MSGRVYPAAKVAAVLVLTLATGACVRGEATTAQPTPVSGGEVLSFADLMKPTPTPSSSPSPSPTSSTAARSSSGSNGSRPSSSGPSAVQPASGPASCPSGVVSGEIVDFAADRLSEDSRDGVAQWSVRVTGTVLNQTSRSIRDIRVSVTIHTDDAESESDGATIGKWVGSQTTANWRADLGEYESRNEPDDKDVTFRVSGWSWGDPALAQCPTPGWSS